jgi:ketosteroid isomerase-like protein
MRSLVVAFLALILAFSASAQPSVELPADVARVLRDYEAAWQARDAAKLAALFAEDGFVLTGGKPPVRGREAIREVYEGRGGPLALRALSYATEGDVGWIIGVYGATAEKDLGKFVLALKRVDGRWMIAADIDNSSQARQ